MSVNDGDRMVHLCEVCGPKLFHLAKPPMTPTEEIVWIMDRYFATSAQVNR